MYIEITLTKHTGPADSHRVVKGSLNIYHITGVIPLPDDVDTPASTEILLSWGHSILVEEDYLEIMDLIGAVRENCPPCELDQKQEQESDHGK